jgi:hypothetical protein
MKLSDLAPHEGVKNGRKRIGRGRLWPWKDGNKGLKGQHAEAVD